MKTLLLLVALAMISPVGQAQECKVEFDPKTDFTKYKTFAFGEAEIITPKDQRVLADSIILGRIRNALTDELIKKGMRPRQDSADLVISYIAGTELHHDLSKNGPLGLTPGSNPDQTFQRDYKQGSLVIDLNDPKNNKLVWRVNALINSTNPDAEGVIIETVMKGFRKFSIKPKKEKRKK